jgi:NAD(P)H-flavin reductase
VVIGGGLTALDTATEALAYYPHQVEKFYERYKILSAEQGEEKIRSRWTVEETMLAEEFIRHAKELEAERKLAKELSRQPHIASLVQQWGGVKIVYRKSLFEAPCYRINREEVEKALEEGISFHENMTPLEVEIDEGGATQALKGTKKDGTPFTLSARTILIAAGTKPNTVLAKEFPSHLQKEGDFFRKIEADAGDSSKENFLTSFYKEAKAISFFGDLHPSYSGSVVKAMASAKEGALVIEKLLKQQTDDSKDAKAFLTSLQEGLSASVVKVQSLAPHIVEVVIKAPFAARNFKAGQFYRLQNFETFASSHENTTLSMEGIAMTGAWVDPDKGLVGLIALEEGGSSKLCAFLKEKEPIVLMGPTGSPTTILKNKTVLLVGGGLGNAVLFSIGQALRQNGSRVVYCAGYKNSEMLFKREEIEIASDSILWAFEELPSSFPCRAQDDVFKGNLVKCLEAYALGQIGPTDISLGDMDQIIVIGSSKMMRAVQKTLKTSLNPYLKKEIDLIASINSPMQCMMKEICAQCLQVHKNPQTGEESVVYSCFNQDQPLVSVDFSMLEERLNQNSLSEKLTSLWVDRNLVALKK